MGGFSRIGSYLGLVTPVPRPLLWHRSATAILPTLEARASMYWIVTALPQPQLPAVDPMVLPTSTPATDALTVSQGIGSWCTATPMQRRPTSMCGSSTAAASVTNWQNYPYPT